MVFVIQTENVYAITDSPETTAQLYWTALLIVLAKRTAFARVMAPAPVIQDICKTPRSSIFLRLIIYISLGEAHVQNTMQMRLRRVQMTVLAMENVIGRQENVHVK